jgi:4'-phosphopantetheinyl transferase
MSARACLGEDVVHVWHADLSAVDDSVLSLLSAAESARAGRLLGRRRRVLWPRARGLLRLLLSEYLAVEPQAVRFSDGRAGKPALSPETRSVYPALRFNVSHSANIAVFAFTRAGEVGIDVEAPRAVPRDRVALTARLFGREHARRLSQHGARAREREFLRLWVRHEAAAKCSGEGIWGRRSREEVPRARARGRTGPREPWVEELDLGSTLVAALAVEREPGEVVCRPVASTPVRTLGRA